MEYLHPNYQSIYNNESQCDSNFPDENSCKSLFVPQSKPLLKLKKKN